MGDVPPMAVLMEIRAEYRRFIAANGYTPEMWRLHSDVFEYVIGHAIDGQVKGKLRRWHAILTVALAVVVIGLLVA